ncbi:MAG TPA: GNAT family protein [Caulobacteraceae bacterium]
MTWPPEIELVGRHVRLTPLRPDHGPALADAVRDGELWKLWFTVVAAPEEMAADIERRLALPMSTQFTVIELATGAAVGLTAYLNTDSQNRRLEIGSTWYRRRAQRTAINSECKRLLLEHAFEALDCIAVEFRTHFLNRDSRRAIERLGAKLDGVLRSHMRMRDGSLRDTCVYSITASEWPTVRADLDARLSRSG